MRNRWCANLSLRLFVVVVRKSWILYSRRILNVTDTSTPAIRLTILYRKGHRNYTVTSHRRHQSPACTGLRACKWKQRKSVRSWQNRTKLVDRTPEVVNEPEPSRWNCSLQPRGLPIFNYLVYFCRTHAPVTSRTSSLYRKYIMAKLRICHVFLTVRFH